MVERVKQRMHEFNEFIAKNGFMLLVAFLIGVVCANVVVKNKVKNQLLDSVKMHRMIVDDKVYDINRFIETSNP